MDELRLDGLSDERVLEGVEVLVRRSNETTAELLAYLAEVDGRQLYLREACGSLFAYCVERLHMSEAAAWKRITAARTGRRFPVVLEMIARGELHLCGVTLLAPHLKEANYAAVLAQARHLSKRAIEKLVAEIAPRPDSPSRVAALPRRVPEVAAAAMAEDAHDVHAPGRVDSAPAPGVARESAGKLAQIAPLAPRRYRIHVTVDEETHATLCQLQDLLSHQIPDRAPAAIIARALAHELERTLARKTGATERPRAAKAPARRTRHIPAAVRREVWTRDGARCAFTDDDGRRCSSTRFLEYHHVHNWARGAEHDPAEIELRCRAHNQYQAVLDYGAAFIAARRRAAPSRAEEPGAPYGSALARAAGRRQLGQKPGSPAPLRFGARPPEVVGRWQRWPTHAVDTHASVAPTLAIVDRHACGADRARRRRQRRFALPRLCLATAAHPTAARFG
jgi:hypothetical protein